MKIQGLIAADTIVSGASHRGMFIVLGVTAVLVAWFLLAWRRNIVAGRRYGFRWSGGRAGFIEFRDGERTAQMCWEMLGGKVDVLISASSAKWILPEERPLTTEERTEMLRRLEAWARATRLTYELN